MHAGQHHPLLFTITSNYNNCHGWMLSYSLCPATGYFLLLRIMPVVLIKHLTGTLSAWIDKYTRATQDNLGRAFAWSFQNFNMAFWAENAIALADTHIYSLTSLENASTSAACLSPSGVDTTALPIICERKTTQCIPLIYKLWSVSVVTYGELTTARWRDWSDFPIKLMLHNKFYITLIVV